MTLAPQVYNAGRQPDVPRELYGRCAMLIASGIGPAHSGVVYTDFRRMRRRGGIGRPDGCWVTALWGAQGPPQRCRIERRNGSSDAEVNVQGRSSRRAVNCVRSHGLASRRRSPRSAAN